MTRNKFMIEMLGRLIFGFIIFSSVLFLPAGTFDWPEAWAFIIILLTYTITLHFLIFKRYPTTLKSRQRYKPVLGFDTLILLLAGLCLLSMFILTSIDVGRFQWTSLHVPYLIKYLGFSAFVSSLVIFMIVIRENVYLSRVVEIQEKQKAITTGPYSIIRHPMYLSNIIFVFSIPLALGSYLGLIPALFFSILFILRIHIEENLLIKDLDGYEEYIKEVRYRLIPYVW